MKGKILNYAENQDSGIILGEDGQRYNFKKEEWKEAKIPKKNQSVDFEIKDKDAIAIYLDSSPIVDMDDVKEKLSDIGLDRENIDTKLASAKEGISKAEVFISPWIDLAKERTKQIFIHGVAYKGAFILSLIIFPLLYVQFLINDVIDQSLFMMLSFIMLGISMFLSIKFAYVKERRKTFYVLLGLFIFVLIYVILGAVFFEDNIHEASFRGVNYFLVVAEDSSRYPEPNIYSGLAFVMSSIIYVMVAMIGVAVPLFINIIVIPAIIILLLIGILFLFKEKYLNTNNVINEEEEEKKHFRWIKIVVAMLTLLLGFVGTFISRYILGEKSLQESLIPTAIHFSLGFLLPIPYIGIPLFIAGVIYIAYLNMEVVLQMVKKYKSEVTVA